ncbi:unnamed protein product [Durusdinium trenchii]
MTTNTTKRNCEKCVCEFLDSITQCGSYEVDKDIAECELEETKCGWEIFKHGLKCILKPQKCKKYVCKTTCKVGKSCFKRMPFDQCLDELGHSTSVKTAVNALKTAKTFIVKDLKRDVLRGLTSVGNDLLEFLTGTFPREIQTLMDKFNVLDMANSFQKMVIHIVEDCYDGLMSFFKKVKKIFKKATNGPLKLPRNKDGEYCALKWDMTMFTYTDCGFFDAWDKLHSHVSKPYDHNMWSTFKKDFERMTRALANCAVLTTKIPIWKDLVLTRLTPFRTLQEMDFCMPKHIADAAETTINALIYAKEHTSDVFDEVNTALKKLEDYATELLSKDLPLFKRGNVSLFEMKKVSAKKGIRGLEESFMCSNKSALGRNYALSLRIQAKLGQIVKIKKVAISQSHAIGFGIYFGCQNLKFKVTRFLSIRWLSEGIGFPNKDEDKAKVAAEIQFKWYHSEFPCFPVVPLKTEASFRVKLGPKFDAGKVNLRTSVTYTVQDLLSFEQKEWSPKKPGWPNGVGIAADAGSSIPQLLQANVSISQSFEEAGLNGRQLFQRVLDTEAQAKEMADWEMTASFDARVKQLFCLTNCECQDQDE